MASIGKKYDVDIQLSGVLSHFYVINMPEQDPPQVHHLSPITERTVQLRLQKVYRVFIQGTLAVFAV
ncbi:MAG: hypothetical protein WKF97_11890 [Chitinophagaceae bacterium]